MKLRQTPLFSFAYVVNTYRMFPKTMVTLFCLVAFSPLGVVATAKGTLTETEVDLFWIGKWDL
jgi:hypothetical protein